MCNTYIGIRSGSEGSSLNIHYVCALFLFEVFMRYMKIAFDEAKKALKTNDIPVGAVIVKNNKIISKACNKKEKCKNSLYHAEVLAINKACKRLKTKNLYGCELYVTLEPCMMCYYAIAESRIEKIYYMINNDYNSTLNNRFTKIKKVQVVDNCEYLQIMKSFFKKLRDKF